MAKNTTESNNFDFIDEKAVQTGKNESIKGMNINFLNVSLTLITALMFCFVLMISNSVTGRFKDVQKSISKFIVCEQCSKTIKESSNNLTELARLFVISHDFSYARKYLEEINLGKSQERAMKKMQAVCSEKDFAYQRLQIAMSQASSLERMELYAMKLCAVYLGEESVPDDIKAYFSKIKLRPHDASLDREKIHDAAIENLFGNGYLIYKTRINENCNLTIESIQQQVQDELGENSTKLGKNISRLRLLFFSLLIVNILIFVVLGFFVLIPLKKFQNSIKRDEKLKLIGATEFKSIAQSYNAIYDTKKLSENPSHAKSEYDSLTGILNRRAFDKICDESSKKSESIALLLIDLDDFKQINEKYGHSGGDTVLQEVAKVLKCTFRQEDYIARIGGDEFAILLTNFKVSSSGSIISKVNFVNKTIEVIKDSIKPVSISVGMAYSIVGYTDILYKQAYKALCRVKDSGKKGCKFYAPSMR